MVKTLYVLQYFNKSADSVTYWLKQRTLLSQPRNGNKYNFYAVSLTSVNMWDMSIWLAILFLRVCKCCFCTEITRQLNYFKSLVSPNHHIYFTKFCVRLCIVQCRREIITVRGQSYVLRLPKYWPPTPLSSRRVCTPRLCCGGRTQLCTLPISNPLWFNVQVLIHCGDGRKDEGLRNEDDRLQNKDDGVKSEDDGVRNEDDGDIVLMAAKLGKVCFLTDTEENILYVIPDEF